MKETFALGLSVLRLPLTYQQGPKLSHPDDDEHRGVVEKCSPQVVIDPNVLTLPWPLRRGLTTSLVMSTTLVLIKQDQLPALATEMGQARCGPHQTTHQETPMV